MKTVPQKFKFLLCQTSLTNDQFVLQTENPQYMFQVLRFDNEEQFCQFVNNNHQPYRRVEGHLVALRLSCALQPVEVTQQTAHSVYIKTLAVMEDACKWFHCNFIDKEDIK